MIINVEQLKQILDLVREHDLSELEIEQEGLRVRVRKDAAGLVVYPPGGAGAPGADVAARAANQVAPVSPVATTTVRSSDLPASAILTGGSESDIELAIVKSPIVGTFYRSSEPGASPFVDIGTTVRKGQVLCIIEAMKLMNEIDSEYDGEIVNVYVEGGQPVQYGERLFAIRTR